MNFISVQYESENNHAIKGIERSLKLRGKFEFNIFINRLRHCGGECFVGGLFLKGKKKDGGQRGAKH